MFTFQCTRCRKKPAIITRGRKVFLCPDCATGSLMYDMVGALMDPDAASDDATADQEVPLAQPEQLPVDEPVPEMEAPTDPWGALG